LTFALDRTVSDAIKNIAGVLEAVTITNEKSGKTYSFVVVDESKMILDKPAMIDVQKKFERIWELVWDKTYSKTDLEESEDDFDSWVSVYDKKPIPLPEMIECRKNTVERIKNLKPRSLLEIGCGTGLLLWRLHDVVECYLGVDPSEQAIDKLGHAVKARGIRNVKVSKGSATRLEEYRRDRFDTVIMNSVVQYFPGTDYLRSVLESVLRGSCDSLFIGDIKSLSHRPVFQTSVALHQSNGSEPAKSCVMKNDHVQANELSVSEELLEILAGDAYGLELQLKREGYFNEMSRYRYDAIFHKLRTPGILEPDISSDFSSMEELERLICGNRSAVIEILGIPNSRLASDVWAFGHASEFDGTVDELLRIAGTKKIGSVDPGDLYKLGDKFSLKTRVVFSRRDLSCINVLFEPTSEDIRTWAPEGGFARPFFTNDPIGKASKPRISQYLTDQLIRMNLPKTPNEVILIHQLPRQNGSLDIEQLINLVPGE
jgi:SAM-dependent methyltransferase